MKDKLKRQLEPVSQFAPMYPSTHWQLYSFMPSVQVPPFSHGLLLHSSTSETKELLDLQLWYCPRWDQTRNRSRLISDVSLFNTIYVLSFYFIRVRALCVEVPQLRCIGSTSGQDVFKNSDGDIITLMRYI